MTASNSLGQQFQGYTPRDPSTAEGHELMPTDEAVKHWDPALKDPETFRSWTGPGYVRGLGLEVHREGMIRPIQINAATGYIHDGHHRLLAARDLGWEHVPVQRVNGRPGEQ